MLHTNLCDCLHDNVPDGRVSSEEVLQLVKSRRLRDLLMLAFFGLPKKKNNDTS